MCTRDCTASGQKTRGGANPGARPHASLFRMRKNVADKIVAEVAEWGHQGLIGSDLLAILNERYAADVTVGRVLMRWLGFMAVFLLAASVLGFIGLSLGDAGVYLASPLLAGFAYVLWTQGIRMATDPKQTYATSGAVLVTFSLMVGMGALATTWVVFGGGESRAAFAIMLAVTSAAAIFTAYRHGLRWPLLLGVLLAYHALGHMHFYGGRGSYFMGIADERITFVAAVAAIVFGMWHERSVENDLDNATVGFGRIYIVLGLLYANMSLWFLTLPRGGLLAVMVFTAGGIAQLVLGGRFHDGRFTGFGIVFLSINIYTRMFENFWGDVSKGMFLLASGSIALIAGYLFEARARKLRAEGKS